MSQDQRRSPRKSLLVEFKGQDAQGSGQLLLEGSDLSSGGTFIRSDLLLERDERLSVEFTLPGLERPVRALARVVWVRRFPKDGEQAGMGVEFLGMTVDDRAALTEFLNAT